MIVIFWLRASWPCAGPLRGAWGAISRATDHEDAMLWPWRPWHAGTPVLARRRALADINESCPAAAARLRGGEFRAAQREMQSPEAKVEAEMLRRARRWTSEPGALVESLRCFAQTRTPPDLATALVRTVCYAWTTTARCHNPGVACYFCGRVEADYQAHYLACRVFRSWL